MIVECLLGLSGICVIALSAFGYYVLLGVYVHVMSYWAVMGSMAVFACSTTFGVYIITEALQKACCKSTTRPATFKII